MAGHSASRTRVNGLVPAIHDFDSALKTWMPATSAGMTGQTLRALEMTCAGRLAGKVDRSRPARRGTGGRRVNCDLFDQVVPDSPFIPSEAGTQTLWALSAWPLGPRFRGDERRV